MRALTMEVGVVFQASRSFLDVALIACSSAGGHKGTVPLLFVDYCPMMTGLPRCQRSGSVYY